MKIVDTNEEKRIISQDYNLIFSKKTGLSLRCGKTLEDDPSFCPYGPEILDLEISVNGCPNNCPFCYKNNTSEEPINMSFEVFKTILDKMPPTLTQIAFGITGIQTNPDFIKMMEYCRKKGIVPNFTLSGIDITDEIANKCSKLVGAVAVSAYKTDKNICYNTVKKFSDLGIEQTNVHLMISQETLSFAYEVINDSLSDERLNKLNAIVFLSLKNKGRAKQKFQPVTVEEYEKLIHYCFEKKARIGFDSCSAPKFEYTVKRMNISDKEKSELISLSESCESFGLFSSYINVFGDFYPCSFAENEEGWEDGISVLNCRNFLEDVWYSEKLNKYRQMSLNTCYPGGCRKCLVFKEINPESI